MSSNFSSRFTPSLLLNLNQSRFITFSFYLPIVAGRDAVLILWSSVAGRFLSPLAAVRGMFPNISENHDKIIGHKIPCVPENST